MDGDGSPADVSLESLLEHRDWVRALARTLVADVHGADDVEQETWRMTLQRPPRHGASLRAWFARVVRREARRARRAEASRSRLSETVRTPAVVPSPEDVVAEAEIQTRLARHVLALGEPYTCTVLYRYFHDLEARDIATRLGVPVETVRTRLKRAVQMLRARMETEVGDDRRAWALLAFGAKGNGAVEGSPLGGTSAAAAGGGVLAMTTAGKAVLLVGAITLALFLTWGHERRARDAGSVQSVARGSEDEPGSRRRPAAGLRGAAAGEGLRSATGSAPPSTVAGHVLDEAGCPVAGALVVAVSEDAGEAVLLGAEIDPARARTATSAADGAFSVADGPGALTVQLVAEAPSFASSLLRGVRLGTDDVTIRLRRGISLIGRVLDMEARPVAGARVRVVQTAGLAEVERVATSDTDGSYRIADLPPLTANNDGLAQQSTNPMRRIVVEAAGFAPLFVEPRTDPEGPFDLVVVRGSTLRGRVVDLATNEPIAGARVLLWSSEVDAFAPPSRRSRSLAERRLDETLTGADGSFVLDHIPSEGFYELMDHRTLRDGRPTRASVCAWKEGWGITTLRLSLQPDGASVTGTLKLRRAASIEGTTVTEDGQPLGGVHVGASGEGEGSGGTPSWARGLATSRARSGPDGRFRIAAVGVDLAATKVRLQASAASRGNERGFTSKELELSIAAGETLRDVRVALSAATASVRADVVVEDAQGRPVAGAVVRSALGGPSWEARADATGHALLVGAPPRNSTDGAPPVLPVIVRARGFALATVEAPTGPDTPPMTRVRLEPGETLSGRVEDGTGRPLAGVQIDVMRLVPWSAAMKMRVVGATLSRDEAGPTHDEPLANYPVALATVVTETDGTFVVEHVPSGPLLLTALPPWDVTAPTGRSRWKEVERLEVRPGGEPVRVVLEEREGPATCSLDMLVVDEETRNPVARASAWADPVQAAPSPGQSSRETSPGRLRIDGLRPGTWRLRVAAPAHRLVETEDVIVRADATPTSITVALPRGATLGGVVRMATGKLAASQEIRLIPCRDDGTTFGTARANLQAGGRFTVSGLSRGRWFVEVGPRHRNEVRVPLGESSIEIASDTGTSDVELTLVEGAQLLLGVPSLPPGTAADCGEIRVEVLADGGKPWAVYRGRMDDRIHVAVPVGGVTARLHRPGTAVREVRSTARSGSLLRLSFDEP